MREPDPDNPDPTKYRVDVPAVVHVAAIRAILGLTIASSNMTKK